MILYIGYFTLHIGNLVQNISYQFETFLLLSSLVIAKMFEEIKKTFVTSLAVALYSCLFLLVIRFIYIFFFHTLFHNFDSLSSAT